MIEAAGSSWWGRGSSPSESKLTRGAPRSVRLGGGLHKSVDQHAVQPPFKSNV